MSMDMSKQVVLVTGAFGGIGRAIAERVAVDGATVVATDIQGAEETVAAITAAGGKALNVTLDVTNEEDWARVVAETAAAVGPVTGLAAAAGVLNRLTLDTVVDLTEEAWDQVLDVDAKGVWLGMRAVIPGMLERGAGRIVNVSSLAAHRGLAGLASYTAAKGAVEALTRQAASEYGRQGVLVNCVAPGTIETSINAGLLATPEGAASSKAMTTIGRWGQPPELAAAVAFLLREGSFVSGQTLLIDGGWAITGGVQFEDSREV